MLLPVYYFSVISQIYFLFSQFLKLGVLQNSVLFPPFTFLPLMILSSLKDLNIAYMLTT